MARAKRKKSPNADLVEAVQNHVDQILLFYEGVEDEQPILVLDYQNQKICAYHYEEYKTGLSPESQATLDEEYEKAMAEDKVVVLARQKSLHHGTAAYRILKAVTYLLTKIGTPLAEVVVDVEDGNSRLFRPSL